MRATVRHIIGAALVTVGATVAGASQSIATSDPAMQFEQRVAGYMRVHQAAEARVPPLRPGSNAQELEVAVAAMAQAMGAARADAKVGDIITPEIAELFRTNIANALLRARLHAADVVAAVNDERPCTPMVLAVNEPFDYFAMTPPAILQVLPALPGELQYRFVGPDLVLVDTHSTLIVDILPGALAVE